MLCPTERPTSLNQWRSPCAQESPPPPPRVHLLCSLGGTSSSVKISATSDCCYGNHGWGGAPALTYLWAPRGSYWFLGQLQERRVCAAEHSWAGLVSLRHPGWGPLDSWHLGVTYSFRICTLLTLSVVPAGCASRIYSTPAGWWHEVCA